MLSRAADLVHRPTNHHSMVMRIWDVFIPQYSIRICMCFLYVAAVLVCNAIKSKIN